MSDAVIKGVLELNRGNFRTEQEKTTQDLGRLQNDFKQAGAAVAVLERQLSSDKGNKELQAQVKAATKEFRELEREMKLVESQKKRLDRAMGEPVKPPTPPPAPAPAPKPEAKPGGHDEHGHGGGGNKGMLAHSARASLEMMMAGQSPLAAAQIEMPKIIQGMGGGLGTMIGVGAGIAVVNKVVESIGEGIAKAKEMGNALRDALRPAPSQGVSSIEAMNKQVDQLDGAIEESKPKIGTFERMWAKVSDTTALAMASAKMAFIPGREGAKHDRFLNGLYKLFGEDIQFTPLASQGDKNEKLRNEALERRKKLYGEIAGQMSAENDLGERAFEHGKASAEADELRLKKAHALAAAEEKLGIPQMQVEIGKVEADETLNPDLKAKRLAQMREELEVKQDAFHETAAQLEREYALRERIVHLAHELAKIDAEARHADATDRLAGIDNAVTKAQHALNASLAKRDVLPKDTPEWRAADDEASNHEVDRNEAQRARAQHLAANGSAQFLAGLRGPEYENHRRALAERERLLNDQLDPSSGAYEPHADKRNDLETERAQLYAEQHRLKRQDQQRAFARREAEIAATTGVGPQAQLDTLGKRLALNREKQGDNSINENDVDVAARLKAETHEIRLQMDAIEYASKRELVSARAVTQEMTLRKQHHEYEANLTGIRAQYEERIAGYLRDGKNDLAQQAATQRDMAVEAAKLARYRQGPGIRQIEQMQARADARDTQAMYRKQARDLEVRRQGYEDDHRASLPAAPAERAAVIAAAVPDEDGVLKRGEHRKDGHTKAREATGNIRSYQVQPDRRGTATADPQGQKPDGKDDKENKTVGKLDEIKSLLQKNLTVP